MNKLEKQLIGNGVSKEGAKTISNRFIYTIANKLKVEREDILVDDMEIEITEEDHNIDIWIKYNETEYSVRVLIG